MGGLTVRSQGQARWRYGYGIGSIPGDVGDEPRALRCLVFQDEGHLLHEGRLLQHMLGVNPEGGDDAVGAIQAAGLQIGRALEENIQPLPDDFRFIDGQNIINDF